MIITRTPFRMSFAGGGTDSPEFYRLDEGAITGTTVNKYMYIMLNERFDSSIRVSYSKTEIAESVDEIQHPIVREAMKFTGVTSGVEIVSVADVPAQTGLGSSSSFTVGLLNALYAYRGIIKSPLELAEEACHLEIDILGQPIGKQDQYLAACGNFCHITFGGSKGVLVEPIDTSISTRNELENNLLLFYMGRTDAASVVLEEQQSKIEQNRELLKSITNLAVQSRDCLISGSLGELGSLLHEGWELKKRLANGITDRTIDAWYEGARVLGASGGKVLGAGGRGFLLLYCLPKYQRQVVEGLPELVRTQFAFDTKGTCIIYSGD